MKKIIALILAVLMVASLAACGGTDGASGDSAAKGSVYWLNFKPEADEALQAIAATYKEETGVDVKVVTAASGTYSQTLTSEMDKTDAPTLFVVGNQAGVATWGDYCLDLKGTDIYNELSTDDFTLYDADGKACSIGYCYESFGIIVNKALLKTAGYEITDIKDFASLKTIVEDIHARAAELGFDAFTSSGLDDSSSWRFSGHLANMPLYYESVADKWDGCPAEIKGTYLENFKNIWDLYMNNSATKPSELATAGKDAEAEFGKGEAVFYQNGSWEYANLTAADKYAMNPEDLQMIPIYCGVEGEEKAGLCSGTENCWAVNAKAPQEDIDATIAFMKWMVTSEAGTKCMAEQFGEIPYKGAAANENVFFQNAKACLEEGKYSVAWAFNYTPNVDEWRAGVVDAMTKYCNGGDWADVETAFVNGWATQYAAVNG
ncbi:MAG: ABC transporter substrate-binding protein [Ruminococcus sp.]|nr:ABC transporter substrate-binding protein [Ruminococcus sp.]